MTKHGIPYSTRGAVAEMVALDGNPIDVLGDVDVILQRTDGPVQLPCIRVNAYVVSSLSAVNADMLVGNDVVAGSGGLSLHYNDDGDLMRVSFGGWDDGSDDLLPSSSADRVTELEKKLALSEQQLSETFGKLLDLKKGQADMESTLERKAELLKTKTLKIQELEAKLRSGEREDESTEATASQDAVQLNSLSQQQVAFCDGKIDALRAKLKLKQDIAQDELWQRNEEAELLRRELENMQTAAVEPKIFENQLKKDVRCVQLQPQPVSPSVSSIFSAPSSPQKPRQLVVEAQKNSGNLSAWVDELSEHVALVHDLVEDTLFQRDFIDGQNDRCLYFTGQSVLLRRPDWHKKSLTPYEKGWFVKEVTSPSTVVISNAVHGGQKTVYVDLLKPDPAAGSSRAKRLPDSANDEVADQSGASVDVFLEMPDCADDGESGYNLRDRDSLRVPSRYS